MRRWGQPRLGRSRRGEVPRAVACLTAVVAALACGLAAPVVALAAHKNAASASQTSASQPTATAAGAGSGGAAATTSNPLSGGVPVSPVTSTASSVATVANSSTNGNGSSALSSGSALIIVIGAIVVLGGIAFFIWRDARRRAPVRPDAALAGEGRRAGSKAPPKSRKLSAAERKRRKRGRAR